MNKLIVLSVDAMQTNDFDFIKKLPHMGKLLQKASVVKNIREVYPTLTYPIHATMITGVYPSAHGIIHNQMPGIVRENPDFNIMGSNWYWHSKHIKARTVVDAANEKGMVTATINWPVMGGQTPTHCLPEIWPMKGQTVRQLYEESASASVVERYFESHLSRYQWDQNIDMDLYSPDIAVDIILRDKPDLLLKHIICVDHFRHAFGTDSPMVAQALRLADIIIGRILQAAKDAGTYDKTNFIILSDHGQINIQAGFNLNVPLCERGFITVNQEGKPLDYTAYSFSAGFSSQIYLADQSDELKKKVYAALLEIQREYPQYIERVYTAEEVADQEGLAGDFAFVVEGTEGTVIQNKIVGDTVITKTHPDAHKYLKYGATHGHSPDKGQKPLLIAAGPDIKEGFIQESGDIIDVCPTIAKLLELEMPDMVGKGYDILK